MNLVVSILLIDKLIDEFKGKKSTSRRNLLSSPWLTTVLILDILRTASEPFQYNLRHRISSRGKTQSVYIQTDLPIRFIS